MEQRDTVGIGLAFFGLVNVLAGALALIDPGTFFDKVGPFGDANDHYIRDAGTFQLAAGVAMAIAVVRRPWRVGVLGFSVLWYAFHSINHLADIGEADPKAYGPVDFAALAIGAVLLAGLFVKALREREPA